MLWIVSIFLLVALFFTVNSMMDYGIVSFRKRRWWRGCFFFVVSFVCTHIVIAIVGTMLNGFS
jgi:hypothetical protein